LCPAHSSNARRLHRSRRACPALGREFFGLRTSPQPSAGSHDFPGVWQRPQYLALSIQFLGTGGARPGAMSRGRSLGHWSTRIFQSCIGLSSSWLLPSLALPLGMSCGRVAVRKHVKTTTIAEGGQLSYPTFRVSPHGGPEATPRQSRRRADPESARPPIHCYSAGGRRLRRASMLRKVIRRRSHPCAADP
jgi:hypothetical protein